MNRQEYMRHTLRSLIGRCGSYMPAGAKKLLNDKGNSVDSAVLRARFPEDPKEGVALAKGASCRRVRSDHASIEVGEGSLVCFSDLRTGSRLKVGKRSVVSDVTLSPGVSLTVGDDCQVGGVSVNIHDAAVGDGSVLRCVWFGDYGSNHEGGSVTVGARARLFDCILDTRGISGFCEPTSGCRLTIGDDATIAGTFLHTVCSDDITMGNGLMVLGPRIDMGNVYRIQRYLSIAQDDLDGFAVGPNAYTRSDRGLRNFELLLYGSSISAGNDVTISGMRTMCIGGESATLSLGDGSELSMNGYHKGLDPDDDTDSDGYDGSDRSLRDIRGSNKMLELLELSLGEGARLAIRVSIADKNSGSKTATGHITVGDGASVVADARLDWAYEQPYYHRCRLVSDVAVAGGAHTLVML